jgi:hypothetical protein
MRSRIAAAHHPHIETTMNTEFGALSAATNPFAAFLSPEVVIAAHERMGSRAAGVVHRPLDKPMLAKAGQEALAEVDAEVDADDEGAAEFASLN